jgi:hypothetical protein
MTERQVREQISRYLAGVISVGELERDLPDGWVLDESRDEDFRHLTLSIMGHVAEFMAGDLTEPQLKTALEPFAAWLLNTTYTTTGFDIVEPTPAGMEVSRAGTSLLTVRA